MRKCVAVLLLSIGSFSALAIDCLFSNSVFYMPDSLHPELLVPYVETNWQIVPHTVHFNTTADKLITAKVKVELVYRNDTGIVAYDKFVFNAAPQPSIQAIEKHKMFDLRRYFITCGKIKMSIKLTDLNDTANIFVATDSIIADNVPAGEPFYSNVQLIDTQYIDDNNAVFQKNGMVQVPTAMNFLDDNKRFLRYYAELYIPETWQGTFPIIRTAGISKTGSDVLLKHYAQTDTIRKAGIYPIKGSFKISSLPSGNYNMNVALESLRRKKITSRATFFQRLNRHPETEPQDTAKEKPSATADTGVQKVNYLNLDKTFVAKYSLVQLRSILKMMLPLTDAEGSAAIKSFLEKPDELYMRYFIYNFFHARNPEDAGKAWKEYSNEVIKVNRMFNESVVSGYETERGFVYLRYGNPTERITAENEAGALPYEIWQYNLLKQKNGREIPNAVFLFYKPNIASRDYLLLHSNVEGEMQNMAWRNALYRQGAGSFGVNSDHKAEVYFPTR
jgi:GWxTD domain-containing protein